MGECIRPEDFNDYYVLIDKVIDWKKRLYQEMPFFDHLFRKYKIKKIIDFECGSGKYVPHFSARLSFVLGADTNPFLIKSASENSMMKANTAFCNSDVISLEMLLKKQNLPKKYDAVLFFNGRLSSIMNDSNLIATLEKSRSYLENDGIIIIGAFNYNRLLKNEDYSFNKISFYADDRRYTLVRHMQIIDPEIIKYFASVHDSSERPVAFFEQLHRPLTKKRLKTFVEQAGFKILDIFGGFNFEEFDPDTSKKLIIIAKK